MDINNNNNQVVRTIKYRDLKPHPILEGILVMDTNGIDIIKVLKEKKVHFLEQIRRIDIALDALEGEMSNKDSSVIVPKRIKWAAEIRNILTGEEGLTPAGIRQKLAEKGITKALDNNYSSSIYATLSRLVTTKELMKTEDGKYLKVIQPIAIDEEKGIPDEDIPF